MSNEHALENEKAAAEDFASLLAEHEIGRNSLQPGQKVFGTVIAVTKDSVFIDLGIKQDGVMDRAEFIDAEGNETVKQGDEVEAWIVGMSSQGPRLSRTMTGSGAAALEEARDAAIPVEGRIIASCKGGYQVEVLGKTAFCPGSQMQNLNGADAESIVGRDMEFLVTRVEHNGRNIVVSRRALVDREKRENLDKLLENIKIGDTVEGVITRLAPFGAFIELAPAVEGLSHISELSWSRVDSPDEAVSVGDRVRVKILSMEKDAKGNLRFGLSLKQAMGDPWENVGDKFSPGDIVEGKVRRIAPFGAFIEIAPGIEGLAHISEFSWDKRVHKPEEFIAAGDRVNVKIKDMAPETRRLSLSIRDAQGDPWEDAGEKFAAGSIVTGKVESRGPLGIFIVLAPGVTGLLPQSVLNASGAKELGSAKPGDEVEVAVRSVDTQARRIALAPAGSTDIGAATIDKSWKQHTIKSPSDGDMGIMAQALQKAMRKKQ